MDDKLMIRKYTRNMSDIDDELSKDICIRSGDHTEKKKNKEFHHVKLNLTNHGRVGREMK